MAVLTFQIQLIDPLLATRLAGEPNSSESNEYIPGSAIRAAMLVRYARNNGVEPGDVLIDARTRATAQHLFFGQNRFLNGYLLDRRENRMLPKPVSWKKIKEEVDDDSAPVYDFAIQEPNDDKTYKSAKKSFCWVVRNDDDEDGKEMLRLESPHRIITIHTQRDLKERNRGRASDSSGAVYRYEALASGQRFGAAIVYDGDDKDTALLLALLKLEYTLGGARTAGYGRVQFSDGKLAATEWREVGNLDLVAGKYLNVVFLSDMLIRNSAGQHVVDPSDLCAALSARLGVNLKKWHAFVDAQVVGGFNRKWGMPLPQTLALKMGSVVCLEVDAAVPLQRLHALEQTGMGEQRAEGFGRIAFNWLGAGRYDMEKSPNVSLSTPVGADALSVAVAQRIVTRMLSDRMEKALIARAGSVEVKAPPARSQLSRLRNIVLNELREQTAGKDRIGEFVEKVKARRSTREQWERARIKDGAQSQNVKLVEWLTDMNKVARQPNSPDWQSSLGLSDIRMPRIGTDVTAKFNPDIQREMALRLIAEVLKRAAKSEGRNDEQE